jgi:signal transduction histidine kinase
MASVEQLSLDLSTLGFVALCAAACFQWYRRRGRAQAMLAISLSLLALVSVLGRIQAVTGSSAQWIAAVTVVAFVGCAYFILLFRDSFVPMKPLTRWAARTMFVVAVAAGVAEVTVLAHAGTQVLMALSTVLVLVWALFIGEPVLRFWLASRELPSVQRQRMRTLSFGFAVLIAIVVVAVIGGTALRSPAVRIAIQLIALAMVPLIYVSVAPPALLRNIWRMGETNKLRAAMQDLLIFSPNPRVLAEQAVGWAMRMIGAHGGFIADAEGKVIASRNMSEAEIREVMTGRTEAGAAIITGPGGAASMIAPLRLAEGTGYIGLLAGRFTPLFGTDEVNQLEGYASSVAAGIERTRVTERMATIEKHKSQFLNLASHELRGPMTVIRGYGSMLQGGMLGQLNERGVKAAGVMMAKITEMNAMIEQMIEAARLEDDSLIIQPYEADLRDIVSAAVERARLTIEDGRALNLTLPSRRVPVKVDDERIQTIVTNLIDNAMKYSPDGGDVSCVVTLRGGLARVAVRDSGVGIAKADMNILFTRFGRVSNPATNHLPGTGLGLYLGRQLARLHGGDITVDSTPGEGSTFTLHLPVAGEALVSQSDGSPSTAAARSAQGG